MGSKRDIVMDNVRGLFVGLSAISLLIPIVGHELVFLLFGMGSGVFYGIRIEKELSSTSLGLGRHEFAYATECPIT